MFKGVVGFMSSLVDNKVVRNLAKELVSKNRYIFSKDVKNVINARTVDEFRDALSNLNTRKPIMPIGLTLVYANCLFFIPSIISDTSELLSKEKVTLQAEKSKAADALNGYLMLLKQEELEVANDNGRVSKLSPNMIKNIEAIIKKIKRVPSPIWKALIKGICEGSDESGILGMKKYQVSE